MLLWNDNIYGTGTERTHEEEVEEEVKEEEPAEAAEIMEEGDSEGIQIFFFSVMSDLLDS